VRAVGVGYNAGHLPLRLRVTADADATADVTSLPMRPRT